MNSSPPRCVLNTFNQHQNQTMVPINPPLQLPLNLPCGELIEGGREDYIKIGLPLYEASTKGHWSAAKAILEKKPELVRFAITKNFDTPLHLAVSAKRTYFVEKLLNMMDKKDVELQNKSYNTAFSLAATTGNVQIAKMILGKNRAVLDIPGNQGMMPLYVAALFARADMVSYLYGISNKMSGDFWTNENRGWVLLKCVEADIFHVAVKIVNECTQLTTDKRILTDVLLGLAKKTDAFKFEGEIQHILRIVKSYVLEGKKPAQRGIDALQLLRIIWKKVAIMPNDEIDQILQGPPVEIEDEQHKETTYPSRVPFIAAEMGNVGFIIELLQSYPDLIWTVDDDGLSIFHVAAKHRQKGFYNLLYRIDTMQELITIIEDKNGNNMLHIVAKSTNPKQYENISGVIQQMQWESLWFQEVHETIIPTYRDKKNKDGETPHEIFRKNHEKLIAESEKRMKEIAPQCLVGATIIATMAFTAAFTAPGGYDQNTGIPMLLHKRAFLIFVIADALSLIFSSTSILIWLAIFRSSYAESSFLNSLLANMLMFGLSTLYFSVTTLMIAFNASLFVLYDNTNLKWMPTMVIGFAVGVPIFVRMLIQLPFVSDGIEAIYVSRSVYRRN